MSTTTYNTNAPYPFQYSEGDGFRFAGLHHSKVEAVGVFVERFANDYARDVVFDEPCAVRVHDVIEAAKTWAGVELDTLEVRAACDERIAFYMDNDELPQLMAFNH